MTCKTTDEKFIKIYETGANYHLVHSLALILSSFAPPPQGKWAFRFFGSGIVLFSGKFRNVDFFIDHHRIIIYFGSNRRPKMGKNRSNWWHQLLPGLGHPCFGIKRTFIKITYILEINSYLFEVLFFEDPKQNETMKLHRNIPKIPADGIDKRSYKNWVHCVLFCWFGFSDSLLSLL